jgi:hypothetical protein
MGESQTILHHGISLEEFVKQALALLYHPLFLFTKKLSSRESLP